ncbi:hypothetical protein Q7465_11045 [Glaesserella parasuis]|nr:hypothetical protein [Glaesserella parasuis]MDP0006248.1 hypothetical protein [Glaesserella parasuis]MDP0025249.1 hypothetical protein [Glaesserella parasuis]
MYYLRNRYLHKLWERLANAAAQPFPANIAAMATVASETASIISTIQSVSLSGMAHSGIDSIPKMPKFHKKKRQMELTSQWNY